MDHTLSTLTFGHNHQLVLLALSMCGIGAITSVRVLQLALASTGGRRLAWLTAASLTTGCTIWSTHFISMLSFDPGMQVGYDVMPTFMSLVVGIVVPAFAFGAMVWPGVLVPFLAGSVFGWGVAAMHYIGMSGFLVAGRLSWDIEVIMFSIGLGMLFGIVGLFAVRKLSADKGLLIGSASIALSVLMLHFTAMGALTIAPDSSVSVVSSPVPPLVLAAAAAVFTCFVLAVALVCIVFDRRLSRGRAEAEKRIHHLAFHDSLTGLPNRAFLGDALRERLAATGENGQLAVLAIDLDRFKQVNDIFGHQAGDSLLRTVSEMMLAELGPNELLARVGGDEFVIVQTGVAQPEGAENLAKRLLDAVCRDVSLEGVTLRAALSVGIALYPRDGKSMAILHPNADSALYRAKQEGRGSYRFFEPEMDLAVRERRALQLEMRDALRLGEFRVYYQPQAETTTGVISGFEALIRWQHPKRGLISPVDFVSAAEENGFIVELGEFVLRTACAEAASWSKLLSISVNLSPVQFQHGDLVALVADVLTSTGLDPARLELEITESVLINDMNRALETLKRIKGLGVCVAMDDFGTGYSSLAYLQTFPFDRIKIDRSFIAGLDSNKQSEAIIRAVVGLGRGLNVPITAEGVETEAQQAFLAELDCAEMQGFLIGKPQPIEMLAAYVGRAPDDKRRAVA